MYAAVVRNSIRAALSAAQVNNQPWYVRIDVLGGYAANKFFYSDSGEGTPSTNVQPCSTSAGTAENDLRPR